MNDYFEKRAKVSDVVIGTELFEVFSICGDVAKYKGKVVVASEPKESPFRALRGSFFFDHTSVDEYGVVSPFVRSSSAQDRNMGETPNGYNFHAFFLTFDDAMRYVVQINADQLSEKLKIASGRMKEIAQDTRDFLGGY